VKSITARIGALETNVLQKLFTLLVKKVSRHPIVKKQIAKHLHLKSINDGRSRGTREKVLD